jgi:hypothetical protein
MRVLISVFVVSVKRQVEPEGGAATTGRVSSSSRWTWTTMVRTAIPTAISIPAKAITFGWSVMTFVRVHHAQDPRWSMIVARTGSRFSGS